MGTSLGLYGGPSSPDPVPIDVSFSSYTSNVTIYFNFDIQNPGVAGSPIVFNINVNSQTFGQFNVGSTANILTNVFINDQNFGQHSISTLARIVAQQILNSQAFPNFTVATTSVADPQIVVMNVLINGGSSSSSSCPTTAEILAAIMNADLSSYTTPNTFGYYIRHKLLTVTDFLALKD